ncbi:MAG: RNA-binding protein [Myxococcota bacterium]
MLFYGPRDVLGQPSVVLSTVDEQTNPVEAERAAFLARGRASARHEDEMAKKLFVGGLSWDTTDDTLRDSFERYGEVTDAKVITDRDTGRSRGFAFVTFADGNAAAEAISALDGTVLDGRTIRVNEAEDKGRSGGGGGGGGGRGPRPGGGGGGDRRGGDRGGRW